MIDDTKFWKQVEIVSDDDSCWLWKGSKLPKGYGTITVGSRTDGSRRQMYAHRLAFEVANGPLLPGEYVCHRCDVPSCCRPSHLFRGTPTDNNADMAAKGRTGDRRNIGERNGRAKLTAADVQGIRFRLALAASSVRGEAERHHVTPQLIRQIAQRRVWRQVP